ncbi:ScbR family autoregulator-binding transcription factor [Streptomyces sp. NPDC060322]|uniref:ScbR family autoregulator-binding transcription factor n=1 Tax=Streptomyces sp. NPDC060322 TaxID=3347097 RepID=UPI00365575E2
MARQERAVRTRQAILEAAAEVFDELGYEATTIAEILQRSGMTKGALYFHFASKQELGLEVLRAQGGSVPLACPKELKLQEAVDRALGLAYLLQTDPLLQGSVRLTVDQGSPNDGLDRRVPMQAWTNDTQDLFREAQAAGELLPDLDLERVAKMFVGAMTGVQILSRTMADRADLPERVSDLYRSLMPSIAVAGVLVRLDFTPNRGRQVSEEALRARHAASEPVEC